MSKNLLGYQPYFNLTIGLFIIIVTGLACSNSQPAENIPIQNILPTLTPTSLPGTTADSAVQPEAIDQAPPVPPEEATSVETDPLETGQTDELTEDEAVTASDDPVVDDEAVEAGETAQNPEIIGSGPVVIIALDKVQEYVEIQNISDTPQDLTGWNIFSERDSQKCNLAGELKAGDTLRIWALAINAAQGGYNCGFSREIWHDTEPDTAILYNADDVETSRME